MSVFRLYLVRVQIMEWNEWNGMNGMKHRRNGMEWNGMEWKARFTVLARLEKEYKNNANYEMK